MRLDGHHHVKGFDVCASMKTDSPPRCSGVLSPPARAPTFRDIRGDSLNCHEESHFFKRKNSFINASGSLHPDLDQLGDKGVTYRYLQEHIYRYR